MKTWLVILCLKKWKKFNCIYKIKLFTKSEKKTEAIIKFLVNPLVPPVL